MSPAAKDPVYVIDVSFFTFRAYYALPPLSTADGTPTNAVHGVLSMVERLIREEKPAYVAVAFDLPGKTFRNDIFPDYKANRDEPDDDLRQQFPLVRRLIDAMALKSLSMEDFEADDILATLAAQFSADGHPVVIVTGDKDLMQCVNEHVTLFDPVKGVRVSFPEVDKKFGVAPEGVVEVQGLMGDSTDNIPGVRGVGPKTATALISHFGTIEAMLERTAEIEELSIRGAKGVRKKIEEGAEAARVSRQLAIARTDVPVGVELEDLAFASPHTPELLALAEELEMERTVARLKDLVGGDPGGADSAGKTAGKAGDTAKEAPDTDTEADAESEEEPALPDVEYSTDWADLTKAKVKGKAASDVYCATADAAPGETPLVGFMRGDALVVLDGEKAVSDALAGLRDADLSLVAYDLKAFCREFGAELDENALDVAVVSYLYDPSAGDHGQTDVVERFLEEAPALPGAIPATLAAALEQLARVAPVMRKALTERKQKKLYDDIERPLVEILGRIEARGIRLDTKLLEKLSADFDSRMKDLVGKVYEAAGQEFNILSPVQLRQILFEKLELPTKGIKKTKTGPSTDSDSLMALSALHPLPQLVLDYRALAKLKSTYVDALPKLVDKKSRIHTRLNQTVTATGRLSSKDPNLQNIPIRTPDGASIRRAFVAERGSVLVSADYNQIELRVLAHLAKDKTLIGQFEQGLDIHAATAAEVFELDPDDVPADQRRAAKVINYGIIYGMGPVRMSRELGIPRTTASEYIERYFARYAGVKSFYAKTLAGAQDKGYVSTLLGRRRYLPDLQSEHGGLRQAAERVATNTPIQGSAADIIKQAMIRLNAALADAQADAKLVLQIHDELLVECPKGELDQMVNLIREAMEGAADLAVPIQVDIGSGRDWGAAH